MHNFEVNTHEELRVDNFITKIKIILKELGLAKVDAMAITDLPSLTQQISLSK